MNKVQLTAKVIMGDDKYSIKLPENYKPLVQDLLKFCKEKRGGFVSFSIAKPHIPRRTGKGSAGNHANGHFTQIANELNVPFDHVKSYMKFLAIGRDYPILKYSHGEPILDLHGNMQGISETNASVEEWAIVIEVTHQFAAEHGIELNEK